MPTVAGIRTGPHPQSPAQGDGSSGNNLFTCSADTQDTIATRITEHNLNRIVIAACSPRTHE
ncbi:MAG: hypothetical protein R6W69_15175, partial [Anaerolineales bacterium]